MKGPYRGDLGRKGAILPGCDGEDGHDYSTERMELKGVRYYHNNIHHKYAGVMYFKGNTFRYIIKFVFMITLG